MRGDGSDVADTESELSDQECACLRAGRRPVIVDVEIKDDRPPGVFDMTSRELPVFKIKKKGKAEHLLEFNNGQDGVNSNGFLVTFRLKAKGDWGFFVDDPNEPGPANAMSVKTVDVHGYCPERGQTWPGFSPVLIKDNRKMLIVENANQELQYFGFALHFSRDGEVSPSLTYDPIGDNQDNQIK